MDAGRRDQIMEVISKVKKAIAAGKLKTKDIKYMLEALENIKKKAKVNNRSHSNRWYESEHSKIHPLYQEQDLDRSNGRNVRGEFFKSSEGEETTTLRQNVQNRMIHSNRKSINKRLFEVSKTLPIAENENYPEIFDSPYFTESRKTTPQNGNQQTSGGIRNFNAIILTSCVIGVVLIFVIIYKSVRCIMKKNQPKESNSKKKKENALGNTKYTLLETVSENSLGTDYVRGSFEPRESNSPSDEATRECSNFPNSRDVHSSEGLYACFEKENELLTSSNDSNSDVRELYENTISTDENLSTFVNMSFSDISWPTELEQTSKVLTSESDMFCTQTPEEQNDANMTPEAQNVNYSSPFESDSDSENSYSSAISSLLNSSSSKNECRDSLDGNSLDVICFNNSRENIKNIVFISDPRDIRKR